MASKKSEIKRKKSESIISSPELKSQLTKLLKHKKVNTRLNTLSLPVI